MTKCGDALPGGSLQFFFPKYRDVFQAVSLPRWGRVVIRPSANSKFLLHTWYCLTSNGLPAASLPFFSNCKDALCSYYRLVLFMLGFDILVRHHTSKKCWPVEWVASNITFCSCFASNLLHHHTSNKCQPIEWVTTNVTYCFTFIGQTILCSVVPFSGNPSVYSVWSVALGMLKKMCERTEDVPI